MESHSESNHSSTQTSSYHQDHNNFKQKFIEEASFGSFDDERTCVGMCYQEYNQLPYVILRNKPSKTQVQHQK